MNEVNEIDVLSVFYEELIARRLSKEELFMSIDPTFVAKLKLKTGVLEPLENVYRLADICIANEWLIRTTADQNYHYLSLTEAGLQAAIARRYGISIKGSDLKF